MVHTPMYLADHRSTSATPDRLPMAEFDSDKFSRLCVFVDKRDFVMPRNAFDDFVHG